MSGKPALNLVVRIDLRRVVFVAQTVIQAQVLGNFPRILGKEIQLVSSDAVDCAGELIIVIGKTANEIGQSTARIGVVGSVVEGSVVVKIVVEVFLDPADIGSELQSVAALGPGKSILILKSGVVNLGGTLRRRAKIERTADRYSGRRRGGR